MIVYIPDFLLIIQRIALSKTLELIKNLEKKNHKILRNPRRIQNNTLQRAHNHVQLQWKSLNFLKNKMFICTLA